MHDPKHMHHKGNTARASGAPPGEHPLSCGLQKHRAPAYVRHEQRPCYGAGAQGPNFVPCVPICHSYLLLPTLFCRATTPHCYHIRALPNSCRMAPVSHLSFAQDHITTLLRCRCCLPSARCCAAPHAHLLQTPQLCRCCCLSEPAGECLIRLR